MPSCTAEDKVGSTATTRRVKECIKKSELGAVRDAKGPKRRLRGSPPEEKDIKVIHKFNI